ncbi:MAG: heparinase II/III family protein, partial [Planctomycetes bacterium]|nr:heparinase II/III family protein [Planctomycetota bacterium]
MAPSRLLSSARIARRMGLRWTGARLLYELRRRAGVLERRTPAAGWDRWSLPRVAPSLAAGGLVATLRALPSPLAPAAGGPWPEGEPGDPPPPPPRAPGGGCRPGGRLPPRGGIDVKRFWEPARFPAAYAAARAWRHRGDAGPAEEFWRAVAAFRAANPPNLGPQWMCGQECAIRVLAWTTALFALRDAPGTTGERAAALLETLAAHGDRIEANIGYAVLQKNNHGVNEALGLFTLGSLLPFLAAAPRWEALGRAVLEAEVERQFLGDGSYVQHSVNYHRLVLQSGALGIRVGEAAGRPLSAGFRARIAAGARWLAALVDPATGAAPNHGSNDGGILLRLDGLPFEDHRPAAALAAFAAERRRVYPAGPWDEPGAWLFGREYLDAPPGAGARAELAAAEGGYHTLLGEGTWAFTRCAAHRDRPGQADLTHVDLFALGRPLAADPGTFAYNEPPPWRNGLAGTGVHNAVSVDGLDQMEKGPRFLWLDWTRGRVHRRASDPAGRWALLDMEQDGYRRIGVRCRRALILLGGRHWLVIDDLGGEGERELSAQWLLPGSTLREAAPGEWGIGGPAGPWRLILRTLAAGSGAAPTAARLVRGEEGGVLGWWSTRYLAREAAAGILARVRVRLPARRAA